MGKLGFQNGTSIALLKGSYILGVILGNVDYTKRNLRTQVRQGPGRILKSKVRLKPGTLNYTALDMYIKVIQF